MPSLGCIADDFTGGTDLSNNLVKRGFRTVQTLGLPQAGTEWGDVDALVIALKSRNLPALEAQALSREALHRLEGLGCRQFYFKYCSTFDSTAAGNIGPVIETLLEGLGETFTIACPAFPDNGRTVYRGHLFVHDQLLHESGMQHHPLTPMTDPNLVRVLSAQTTLQVGLIRYDAVARGAGEVRQEITRLRQAGVQTAIGDAVSNGDLMTWGQAILDLKLITGGSGLALGLRPPTSSARPLAVFNPPVGKRAVLAGSCSQATLAQIDCAKMAFPSLPLSPFALAADFEGTVAQARRWAEKHLMHDQTVLIYSSAEAAEVASAQAQFGVQHAGELVEKALASLAVHLVGNGVRRLIVAGGETSGAVVRALNVAALRIGPEIAPGVPWTVAIGNLEPVALALKSGNFGATDFFTRAWDVLL
ncbi:MAG TPA: 3-oxo-tetronate kinase [Chthoniobacterales bacterium]